MDTNGEHVICDVVVDDFADDIKALGDEAIKHSGLHVVDFMEYNFCPQGKTVIWILAESHFIIHTYPEHNYYSIDCYTCGDEGHPSEAVKKFVDNFDILNINISHLKRGIT